MRHLTFASIALLIYCNLVLVEAQQCRSYNRKSGYCVSIMTCPPLLRLLQNNPTVQELRQLQRLTCGFDNQDPKVCCPYSVITPPLSSTSDRLAAPPVKETSAETTPTSTSTTTTKKPLNVNEIEDRQNFSSHSKFALIPKLSECSEVFVTRDRVVGGKHVDHGTYPWMARIGYQYRTGKKLTYYCGGSIINKRYILTAAHCTEGLDEYIPKEVRLGENDVKTETDCNEEYHICSKAEDYKIEKIIPHSNYSTSTKHNDISLIRVDRDISFESYFIKPICLPFLKEYDIENLTLPSGLDSAKAIVAGWGRTVANKNDGSDSLLDVVLPLKTNEECQSIYTRRVIISPKQICAGGEAGMDSCGGDSGGPLITFRSVNAMTKRTKLFQTGVVSYGPVNCGVGGLPGVYARVSQYLDWILENIEPS
ncbi:unnamed protein product [Allacma fusca]|uniref:limulus clotting factor C n=1 Tax=Allacma fusca TaxID=39272 RepID=A0A8J2P297_9HEXA|nr:unnamed protein product [Allacma fusca]